jgi:hypothetical protein
MPRREFVFFETQFAYSAELQSRARQQADI